MPEIQRRCFLLYYEYDFNYYDIGTIEHCTAQAALNEITMAKGLAVGQYLDINFFKVIGAERSAISQTAKKLIIVIDVPDSLKSKDSIKYTNIREVKIKK